MKPIIDKQTWHLASQGSPYLHSPHPAIVHPHCHHTVHKLNKERIQILSKTISIKGTDISTETLTANELLALTVFYIILQLTTLPPHGSLDNTVINNFSLASCHSSNYNCTWLTYLNFHLNLKELVTSNQYSWTNTMHGTPMNII